MFKRVGFFILTNIAVVVTVSIVLNLLGVNHYISEYGLDYTSLAVFCLVWGMVGSFISLLISKFIAKKMMGVQIVDADPRFAELVNTVHRLSKAANLSKMPEVGVYDSPEINAFATGPSKNNSLVAVSSGLLNKMDNQELEGVLAHEVAHISNGDMVTMALVQGVVNAFVMFFARIAAFAVQNAMRSDDDDAPVGGGFVYMLTVIAFEILFGILGLVVVSFFSRIREYRADEGGARLAGKSNMIAALKKLQVEFNADNLQKTDNSLNAMKISAKEGGLRALMSTHPKLEDRIRHLQSNNF